ncbi:AAA family ATPase [Magnetovibrio sp.]|uniref:bifunctional aminoglycoside phosphotransferase/ATP-binding protein n=1 Tax=Magnetovibrio sp. TaxID=2024836 RepID=UPI002F939DC8
MIKEDQSAQVALLSDPAVFGDGTDDVKRVTTHASHVFIGKTRVYKLKRAVEFPFMDYSDRDKRLKYCEAEVALNRRTAPNLYLGVKPITRDADGRLQLDKPGEVVDWVVEMARFDEATLFDHLAAEGKLDRHLMEHLADNIATFHAASEARQDGGGRIGIALTIESNAKSFAENAPGLLDMGRVAELTDRSLETTNEIFELLESRRMHGCVRHCHGDMHLRNIFLDDGEPVLFDCIEFNETFSTIDVLYDLAFLLMDLDYRGLRTLANVTMNRYMDITGSAWGLATLPLFLSVRAGVRSFVACAAAKSVDDPEFKKDQARQAQTYLDMALNYLSVPEPRLIAVGGLSGSGKSRLGRDLAQHIGAAPGARVVRSDVLRKRIAGKHPLDRLGPEGYTADMTAQTYQAVYDEARAVLATGHSVIADCVFSKPEERAAIETVAVEMGVPFDGFWLSASPEIMQARVTAREKNASDADAEVVRMQLGYDLGDITWHQVDSSGSREETDAQALQILNL